MPLPKGFSSYCDKNGYLNPSPADPNQGRQCDNATMFTTEAYVMAFKLGLTVAADLFEWKALITNAMTLPGLPGRYPGYTDQDSPDDMVAIMCGAKVLGFPSVARSILWYGLKNKLCFNNGNPGAFNWGAMTWRQPQLFAATIAAAFPSMWNPIHWLIRILCFPFFFYSALVILASSWPGSTSNTDARRLCWHLIQSVGAVSLLCFLMSLVWRSRLFNDYGPTGMQAVAGDYYQPNGNNPYQQWVT